MPSCCHAGAEVMPMMNDDADGVTCDDDEKMRRGGELATKGEMTVIRSIIARA